jgi:hypothetical protein
LLLNFHTMFENYEHDDVYNPIFTNTSNILSLSEVMKLRMKLFNEYLSTYAYMLQILGTVISYNYIISEHLVYFCLTFVFQNIFS